MTRAKVTPVFVSRQTAAEMLEISVDTFDTWVSAGFVPAAHIKRGQIVRWHWPTLEERLAGRCAQAATSDPFTEGLKNIPKARRRVAAKGD
jgi:hypothetical protein